MHTTPAHIKRIRAGYILPVCIPPPHHARSTVTSQRSPANLAQSMYGYRLRLTLITQRTVHSRNHRLQSRTSRRAVHANTPQHARTNSSLNVAGSVSSRRRRHGVLRIIHHANIHALARKDVLQSIHRTGTRSSTSVRVTINVQTNTQSSRTGISRININRLNTVLTPTVLRIRSRQVLIREDVPQLLACLLYTSPSPRDYAASRMPSSA